MTREEWLIKLMGKLRPWFKDAGHVIPEKVRISVGWPKGVRGSKKFMVRGQCWRRELSTDGHSEIFITPQIDDGFEVAIVLVHELVHAVVDCEDGHRGVFKKTALDVGLIGKMTTSEAGPELTNEINRLLAVMPPFPHAQMVDGRSADTPKKQTTRMIKIVCPACEYAARTTKKWLIVGLPVCCCGTRMEAPDVDIDELKSEVGDDDEG